MKHGIAWKLVPIEVASSPKIIRGSFLFLLTKTRVYFEPAGEVLRELESMVLTLVSHYFWVRMYQIGLCKNVKENAC